MKPNCSAKILIVEDNSETLTLLKKLLSINSYNTFEAQSMSKALELLKNETPDVIISGWSLPAIDGPEFCRAVKSNEKFKTTYLIILTSKATLNDRISGLDFGADDFIVKPVENQELLARIRTGIRIHDLQNELKKIEHEKALIEMACTIGHQINNPLSSLMYALKSVKFECLKGGQNEDFDLMEKSVSRIKNLAAELIHLKDPKIIDYVPGTSMLKLKGSAG
ncbi:MAG TPA: response regulator [Ignavibacteriaceae bacterium]|nr:response regulator [Ignavibacteriaceae bacterium]